jgi:hypothetical protein
MFQRKVGRFACVIAADPKAAAHAQEEDAAA